MGLDQVGAYGVWRYGVSSVGARKGGTISVDNADAVRDAWCIRVGFAVGFACVKGGGEWDRSLLTGPVSMTYPDCWCGYQLV